jgi:hypothetical protein
MILNSLLINIIDFKFTLNGTGNTATIPIPIRIGVTPTTRLGSSNMFLLNHIFNFIAITTPTSLADVIRHVHYIHGTRSGVWGKYQLPLPPPFFLG